MNGRSHPGPVSVAGAGPAGLAAAIELARHGVPVTVYERRRRVGARFHGDFQGLENWSTEEDVLVWLRGLGIELDCPYRPTREVTLVDPALRRWHVRAERPLLYLVERGPNPGSLDRSLAERAEEAGARIRMGAPVRLGEIPDPVIVATGPAETQAAVAGVVAETSHPDQVVAIARDCLAPKCYAYCVIWRGRATLATALARDFRSAWSCFRRARATFARLGLRDFRNERRVGGRASVRLGGPYEEPGRLRVGEAAGLQDYLLGFGLRYALLSGHLAARSLLTREPYGKLVERFLGEGLRAGFVNRLIYDRLGDPGYGLFIRWVARAPDVRRRARRVYSLTPLHRALWPVAARLARRNGGSLTPRGGRVRTGGGAAGGRMRASSATEGRNP